MKLKDTKAAIESLLPADVYADLDRFLKGPRNQLAHRYLIERVEAVRDGGLPVLSRQLLELLEVSQEAERLSRALFDRAMEIHAEWGHRGPIPEEARAALDANARAMLMKQFPADVVRDLEGRRRASQTDG